MCFSGGSGGADDAAEEAAAAAAAAEAKRKKAITEGRANIDATFSKFDPAYYQQIGDAYNSYYQPQLADQYEDARKNLTYGLARKGILASSAAGDQFGKAKTEFDRQRVRIGSQAQDRVAQAKADVEQNRSDLYALNEAAADPNAIAGMSASRAASIQPQQSLSPLENVFASFLNSPATSALAYQYAANRPISPTIFNPGNSVRVVT